MPQAQLQILYEDNHLLALNKPAGVAVMRGTGQSTSLLEQARHYLKVRYNKPGNVYLGLVSRLDACVSGVLLLARTSKAAARLSEQFRLRRAQKTYWAVVTGLVADEWTTCADWLLKDDRRQRMVVVAAGNPTAQEARLRFRALWQFNEQTLVEIELETGRKHQIRVQLANHGHSILGDIKYGSRLNFPTGIALHARRLVVEHPTRKSPIDLLAPLPRSWRSLGLDDLPE